MMYLFRDAFEGINKKDRHEWRNGFQLSAVSHHCTFRSGAIYCAINCARNKLRRYGMCINKHHHLRRGSETSVKPNTISTTPAKLLKRKVSPNIGKEIAASHTTT